MCFHLATVEEVPKRAKIADIARYLGVRYETVQYWCRNGLQTYRRGERLWTTRERLLDYLEGSGRIRPPEVRYSA